MENTVHDLASRVPTPQRVPFKDSFVFRHIERTIHQAIVQKLARMVSTLRAAELLMEHGYLQEQAALQRVLDEIQEDVVFLAFGAMDAELSDLHSEYLAAFFEEEFDKESALESTQRRPMIPRKKIHAYLSRVPGAPSDKSTSVEVSRTVSKAYSGYVHAASPQVMDMFGGDPPVFHMGGMRGTERQDEHRADLWNYFYRGTSAFAFAAKAFGDMDLFNKNYACVVHLEELAGKDYASERQNET
ncbi:hypothetical protein [Craterilacuibacter sp. RT1T]|uniref:hypothetical protein n=1 Tax=Craterilacuibacter sp. RT1T TaxID=2942211 RepID=UPI0020BF2FF9|nr:hypothetical protein [Craterilacuibacter sp. RT1T]MCL6263182.1 hypothetical protein [Craterilacuibacter sp. RT1T]